ncbi:BPSS1780 family membrane protein [Paludibacterium paludis]|uniref:Transmembrane protein n=1 Tax=Paludibacterium paludis TaxID=1225769 RepID=A0A918P1G6_9NEIS|nr:BPSS1780 family membrane protein [Paludibacterium paludis]GGY12196.1 hypothetical protein GCM10011289_14130 [Paludibacterium paludis]
MIDLTTTADSLRPAKVRAGSVFGWISRGWAQFRAQPLIWVLFGLVTVILPLLLSVVPILGRIGQMFLHLGFVAGFALCARRACRGEAIEIADLFGAIRQNWRPLAVLTLVQIVFLIAVAVVIVGIALGIGFGFAGAKTMMTAMMDMDPSRFASLGQGGSAMLIILLALVFAAFSLLIESAFLFAPILVTMQGLLPLEALMVSFRAVLTNWAAFLVMGVVFIVLIFLGVLPMLLGLLIVCPLYYLALYAAWQDVFPE